MRKRASLYSRYSNFGDVANNLLANHDNHQLYAQVQQAAPYPASVETSVCQSPVVTRGASHVVQLEESNVEDGRVRVDKLEEEHLVGEAVFVVCLGARIFPVRQPQRQFLVEEL